MQIIDSIDTDPIDVMSVKVLESLGDSLGDRMATFSELVGTSNPHRLASSSYNVVSEVIIFSDSGLENPLVQPAIMVKLRNHGDYAEFRDHHHWSWIIIGDDLPRYVATSCMFMNRNDRSMDGMPMYPIDSGDMMYFTTEPGTLHVIPDDAILETVRPFIQTS